MKVFKKIWAIQPLRWILLTSGAWILWSVYDVVINKEKFFTSITTLPFKINQYKITTFTFLIIFIFIAFIFVNLFKKINKLAPSKYYEIQADNQRMQKHVDRLIEQMNAFYKGYEKLSQEDRRLLDEIKPFVDRIRNQNIYFAKKAYWIKSDESKIAEGPFCPSCKDDKGKVIHMSERSDSWFVCPICDYRAQINKDEEGTKTEIHSIDESIFILDMLASQANKSLSYRIIEQSFLSKYPSKKVSDLAILFNDLKRADLIEDTEYGEWGEIGFSVLPNGLDYLKQYKTKTK